ncbi:hypothetical protein CWI75_01100 [Kineobactrum sediminis]|uniref:Flagellar protein FliT n=1 Tax=Kineobactrum sediminis TaxID=1905677 RepID=A0A2N5Y6F6_9GAMM|nr:hypothetical protein [Kineobactrum sediminis]PLW83980.1 hypothetical protein CWI75_01100 [Kineobactrum sediminis]
MSLDAGRMRADVTGTGVSAVTAQMSGVVALGVSIRQHIEQADLEGAGELAAERHRCLVALFDVPDTADESLSSWLQEILREDQSLLQALAELRGKMELELGATRRSARGAREYAAVAENRGR